MELEVMISKTIYTSQLGSQVLTCTALQGCQMCLPWEGAADPGELLVVEIWKLRALFFKAGAALQYIICIILALLKVSLSSLVFRREVGVRFSYH